MSANINTFGQSIPFSVTASQVFNVVARGETQRIERHNQLLGVISGSAWVSFDGFDFIVRQDETLRLEAGNYPALISALGHENVVYEIS